MAVGSGGIVTNLMTQNNISFGYQSFEMEILIFVFVFCRYNPENLATLEKYIAMQAQENTYDLEANLAVLKL